MPHKFTSKAVAEHKVCEVLWALEWETNTEGDRKCMQIKGKGWMWIFYASCHAVPAGVVRGVNKIDRLTGLLFCGMTAHNWRKTKDKRQTQGQKEEIQQLLLMHRVGARTRVQISSSHQRWREGQTSHRGFELVHGWRDTLGAVRHQRLDLDFELFSAVLVVLRVTGGEKLLFSGIWWTCVKEKVIRARQSGELGWTSTSESGHSSVMSQRAIVPHPG